ncbi:MAG TPA: hypothetical protein VNI84_13130 [Pyrinomonadaceae bacterium]|nr:hypothetical protein [Pyrinomonadaceae bacterium]
MLLVISGIILLAAAIVIHKLFSKDENSSKELPEKDAERFAMLLVAEIKLNENYKVERGLRNNNLYESLRNEIEEARKKYKKRIPDADFQRFYDEALIKFLADGDESKLGLVFTSLKK